MSAVQLLTPGPLQTERLPNGRRRLLRPLRLNIEGRVLEVPAGFTTDYSSWPVFRVVPALIVLLGAAVGFPGAVFLAALVAVSVAPRWSKIDLAGVAHDALYAWAAWGPEGDPMPRRACDRVWRLVALSGKERAHPVGAWVGWAGLRAGGWAAWRAHRRGRPIHP